VDTVVTFFSDFAGVSALAYYVFIFAPGYTSHAMDDFVYMLHKSDR